MAISFQPTAIRRRGGMAVRPRVDRGGHCGPDDRPLALASTAAAKSKDGRTETELWVYESRQYSPQYQKSHPRDITMGKEGMHVPRVAISVEVHNIFLNEEYVTSSPFSLNLAEWRGKTFR